MNRVLDPEGVHLGALRRLADFAGREVLEVGCGDGRLTTGLADDARRVFAFDPDAAAIAKARASRPSHHAGRVVYEVASGRDIVLEPASFDLVVFSWSL